MGLEFICGCAGSGKSTWLYERICEEAAKYPAQKYLILVPDQFTLETQKTLVEISGGKGILNIDILSFHRLAFRAFEQFPALEKTILEDMGKTMLLRKIFSEQKQNLQYFNKGIDRPGFLDECKSFLCELEQYGIREEEQFEKMETLGAKFQDIHLIHDCFREKMGDTYQMAEELICQLTSVIDRMDGIRDAVVCLDGFTGFTPTQYELLEKMLRLCRRVLVTVTTDETKRRGPVFEIATTTIRTLTRIANRIPVEVKEVTVPRKGRKAPYRFQEGGELAFLEHNLFCYPYDKWENITENMWLYIGNKPADEAAYVARSIWWMLAEGQYQEEEIAVVTGSISSYEQEIVREFERLGIRYFLDSKKNIGANWIAEYIQAVLEMYRLNMDAKSTFRFLRCGLSPLTRQETDLLENYVLATGKRGFSAWLRPWRAREKDYPLDEINEIRQKVVDCLQPFFEAIRGGRKRVEVFIRALYDFLVSQEVYDRLLSKSQRFSEEGQEILAKEYKNVYKVVMNLLDEMMELLGDEVVSLEEFQQILSAGISEGLVGFVPPKKHQVMVGDIERTRLKDIKVLFFMGFSDDFVPAAMQPPGIVNHRERHQMEKLGIPLAPTGNQKVVNDLYYLYINFTKPSEKLIFTYSRAAADGTKRQASYILGKIQKIFPHLRLVDKETERDVKSSLGTDRGLGYLIDGLTKETYAEGEEAKRWWEIWKYYATRKEGKWLKEALDFHQKAKKETKLSEEALEILYGNELKESITRLETYAKCPFSYYLMYGLRLREREEYTVEAPDFGNVVHHVLKDMDDAIRGKNLTWQTLSREESDQLVETCVNRVVEGYRDVIFSQSNRIAFMRRRILHMMKRTAWAISEQLRHGAFRQKYGEKYYSYEEELGTGTHMKFRGVIDRVDVYEDEENIYVKVVDYKTGNVDLSLESVYYGLQLQLILYLDSAMEAEKKHHPDKNVEPAGMLYFHVQDPQVQIETEGEVDEIDFERSLLSEYSCKGYVNEKTEILEKLDAELGCHGELNSSVKSLCYPVKTKKDGTFAVGTNVFSDEMWEKLIAHVKDLVHQNGKEILEGNIRIHPYRLNTKSGCDYCGMKDICGIEKNNRQEVENVLEGIDKAALLQFLKQSDEEE